MRWFGKRRSEPSQEANGHGGEDWEVHPSLALSDLFANRPFDGSEPQQHLHVVDLGSAQGSNIAFLAERFPCSVEVVDLVSMLPELTGLDAEEGMARAIPAEGEPADLVLAWDALNYLSKEQFRAAGERLARRCRPGALVFVMIATGATMARQPGTYLLRQGTPTRGTGTLAASGGIELVYRHLPSSSSASTPALGEAGAAARTSRQSPRFRPAEVDAMFPGFSVHRSMLLRHGFQEFLMVRDRDPAANDVDR